MQQQPWMAHAWRELGVREAGGSADNARVLAYFRDVGHPAVVHDEVAWCAAFVGACLERAGIRSTRALNARSYLGWGEEAADPPPGAIAVLSRTADPTLGHVGFVLGMTADAIVLLGGNQTDAVTVTAFERSRVLGFRLPQSGAPAPAAGAGVSGFEAALAHVLEMEGGYTDDPHDPGGPTNRGITLVEWARQQRTEVTAETIESLKAGLRAIPDQVVRSMYLSDYWQPSRAAELSGGLGLMHFDAAVNHGLGRAARLLQEALDVTVDGEIGPETLAAARDAVASDAIERYADARRRTYRSLPHFWRFGRGWLRRVDATLARALALAASPEPTIPANNSKEPPIMSDSSTNAAPSIETAAIQDPKWWGQSMTIWGVLITTVTTVLPTVGPLIGLDISGELARQLGDGIVRLVQSVGGLAGTVLAILGRARATTPLERRLMQVRL